MALFNMSPGHLSDVNKNFVLYYFYDSLLTLEKIETVVFDLGDFLSAAGGNIGRMLGFSCISIMFSLISGMEYALKYLKGPRFRKFTK